MGDTTDRGGYIDRVRSCQEPRINYLQGSQRQGKQTKQDEQKVPKKDITTACSGHVVLATKLEEATRNLALKANRKEIGGQRGMWDYGKTKHQIWDRTLPQRSFDHGTPSGAEAEGSTPRITGRGRQRERAQATAHNRPAANSRSPAGAATSAKEAPTKRHSRQEPSTHKNKQSTDKRTRSGKDPTATACKSGGQPQDQTSHLPEHGNGFPSKKKCRVNLKSE
jgi:hypothetical protein